jgi:hypothetical protein
MVDLGVGKNMVRAIRFWSQAAGLVSASKGGGHSVTRIGNDLLGDRGTDQIVGDKERPDELAGGSGRRRERGNEVEEAVQSEDKKDEAKKETSDDSNDFHVSFVYLIYSILTSI